MKRKIRYIVFNATLLAGTYHYFINGQEWAGNIVKFLFGLGAVFSFCAMLVEEVKVEMAKQGRSVPAWLADGVSAFPMLLFAAHGQFMWATIIGFITVAEHICYGHKPKTEE